MAEFPYCKLEIFIPEPHLDVLRQALTEVDAGHIGSYDCCLSYSPVTGCWRPLAGTSPYLGREGGDLRRTGAEGGGHLPDRAGG